MNKAQLVELVAEKTKSTKSQSEMFLDATLKVIQDTLKKGDDVKLVGFGTFSKSVRKSRQGRNPKTGEAVKIPKSYVPRFRPGKDLKESLN